MSMSSTNFVQLFRFNYCFTTNKAVNDLVLAEMDSQHVCLKANIGIISIRRELQLLLNKFDLWNAAHTNEYTT